MMIPSEEEVSRMERLAEVARELCDMQDELTEVLDTLKELQGFKLPTQEEAQRATQYREELEAIQELQEA